MNAEFWHQLYDGLSYYMQSLISLCSIKLIAVGGGVAGFCTYLGGDSTILWCLTVLMCADFVFGFLDAVHRHRVRCRVLARGVFKFLTYGLVLCVIGIANKSMSGDATAWTAPMLNFCMTYLCFAESVSVISHMQRLGLPVPALLARIAQQGRRKIQRKIENIIDDDHTPHGV